jgi:hypothetical protein
LKQILKKDGGGGRGRRRGEGVDGKGSGNLGGNLESGRQKGVVIVGWVKVVW